MVAECKQRQKQQQVSREEESARELESERQPALRISSQNISLTPTGKLPEPTCFRLPFQMRSLSSAFVWLCFIQTYLQ